MSSDQFLQVPANWGELVGIIGTEGILCQCQLPYRCQAAPNCLGNGFGFLDEFGEFFGFEGLIAIGGSVGGVEVDFDDQPIGTCRDARAMALTYSQCPVEWLGSRITGRCVRALRTGMALMSVVLRVEVS